MACNQLEDRLQGYFDGELDAASAAEFERHLHSCLQCSAALDAERALRGTLATAQLYERAPAKLRGVVQTLVVPPLNSAAKATQTHWKWLAIAATILFAISSGVLTFTLVRGRSTGPDFAVAAVDAHLRSLQQGHLADVQSTDQHTVKPWFDGRVDFAPKVADFSAQGFPLVGGRLDVLNGRTVAALVYARRKHVVNVFIAQPGAIPVQSGAGEMQGYHWLVWHASGLDYVAVTDAAAADLDELHSLFGQQ